MSRFSLLTMGCAALAALAFSGCATKSAAPAVASATASDRVILKEGQYEYVSVTGSQIPVLAAKEPLERTFPQTASQVVSLPPEAFRRMQERALASSGGR